MSILLQRFHFKNHFIPFLFTLLLSACTGDFFGNNIQQLLRQDANASSDFYLNRLYQAQNATEQQTYKLLAARVMLNENKLPQAQALLTELTALSPEQQLDKQLIEAHLLALQQQNTLAEQLLHSVNLTLLSRSQTARYYDVQSRIAQNRYDAISAVKANIKAEPFLTDLQHKQANIDRTWTLLRHTNQTILENAIIDNANIERDMTLAGWLQLAQNYNQNVYATHQLSQIIQQWRNAYPSHPASRLMPSELQGLIHFQPMQFSQVALLLPMGGNQLIGKMIKAGFDAAKGNSPVQVQLFDTMSASIEEILNQIKQANIETVVGPLQKTNVEMLINNPSLTRGLNVLSLNAIGNERALPQMCFYGLLPENEAESAANRIWQDGISNPLVFVPQNDLGQRTANAFNLRWQRLTATDANIRFYNQLADIAFPTLEADEPNDLQAVYVMVTSPEQLAEIKTSVDNSGRNIKLYTNSRSHSGNTGAAFRSLTEGVLFSDIPLFNDMTSTEYKNIVKTSKNDFSLMRLYAMGADAWLLINHFNELRQIPSYAIDGLTGRLSATNNCNIQREMTWFTYQNGQILPLN